MALEKRQKKSERRAARRAAILQRLLRAQERRPRPSVSKGDPPIKFCLQCGKQLSKWGQKFCCIPCRRAAAKSRHIPSVRKPLKVCHCVQCLADIPREPGVKYGHKILCSAKCKQEWRDGRKKPSPPPKIAEPRECRHCGRPVNLPRKSLCSVKCERRHFALLQNQREKECKEIARCFYWPEKRECPVCKVSFLPPFINKNKRYCSHSCKKIHFRKLNRRNRLAKGDRRGLVKQALSGRIREILKRSHSLKRHTTLRYLGCTSAQLREHLEQQFTDGMDWSNYGVLGWHVDHILPCAVFDLAREDHQMICFNYKNLRPLWYQENHSKADTVDMDVLLASDFHLLKEARRLGVKV